MGLDVWCLEQKAQRQVNGVMGETERRGPRGFHLLAPGVLGSFSPRAGIPEERGGHPRKASLCVPVRASACRCGRA